VAGAEDAWPGLTVDLTPDPAAGEVDVALRLSGDTAAQVRSIGVARAWADTRGASAIVGVTARDGEGDLPLRDGAEDGPDRIVLPARPPRGGELAVHYRARANGDTSRFGLRLDGRRVSGVGHAFLLLPRIEAEVPVRIRWHLAALGPGASAATSFGTGAIVVTRATSEMVGSAAYIAGLTHVEVPLAGLTHVEVPAVASVADVTHVEAPVVASPTHVEVSAEVPAVASVASPTHVEVSAEVPAVASVASPTHVEVPAVSPAAASATHVEVPLPSPPSPDAPPGPRLVVLGTPAFDTRAAFYWSVTALTTLTRFFEPPTATDPSPSPPAPLAPFSFLLIAEPGLGGAHDGAALTDSFALWFDQGRAFDAGLKSVVAHELTHRYLGGALRLEDPGGNEAVWFSEGFTVHLARRWLLESGMVTPRDVLGDLRRTMDDRPSPDRVGACAASPSGRSQEEYRRGARYAALTDVAIQKASSGHRGIDDLVRELLARARSEHRSALPLGAWRDAVQRELGDAGGATFDRLITRGEAMDLPDDAFGPCFHRASREDEVFDLGFDRRSLAATPAVVTGVTRGSAADKAGLRDGALVIASRLPAADAAAQKGGKKIDVVLTIAGRGGGKKIRYRPWVKRHSVVWEAQECSKRR
jgi:hypothetical protein